MNTHQPKSSISPRNQAASAGVAWTPADLEADPHAVPDKAQRVRTMFAAIARRYDLNNRLHSFWRDQAWRRAAVRFCHVQPSDSVLDVACGTGDLTFAFAAANPASVTGLDFTAQMLEIARDKASRLRLRAAPTFIQGDAMSLPFADASFDIVSIAFGIRNVADSSKALREFRRVLRPGGRLVVLEFSQPRNPILRWLNNLYTQRMMPFTATLIARDRSGAYRYLPKSVEHFVAPEQFADLLRECGFASVDIHRLTFGVCVAYLARTE